MRAILHCILALLISSALVPAQRGRREDRSPEDMQHFTVKRSEFASKAVGQQVPYCIYLPDGYDADAEQRYPLIVWLHGMWEDEMRFHSRGGAVELDAAVAAGKLPPCVFVCANGGRSSMYVNRGERRWQDLISDDLLAHVSETYRVERRRERRAIMGVSMGGMGALRIAFTRPELFGAVAVHSSAVFCEDPEQLPDRIKGLSTRLGLDEVFGNPIEKEPWQKANPLCIAGSAEKDALQRLRIYFDAGTNDRLGLATGNQNLHQVLQQRGIRHTWRLIEGGGHSWRDKFQHQALPHSFAFVGRMFRGEPVRGEADASNKEAGGTAAGKGR